MLLVNVDTVEEALGVSKHSVEVDSENHKSVEPT